MWHFQTPPSRNIRNNKAWKSAGDEWKKRATGGSHDKKQIWFGNVCMYAFKLQLMTPLWADGWWCLTFARTTKNRHLLTSFSCSFKWCQWIDSRHKDAGALQCVFACPLTCITLSHSTWLQFLAWNVGFRVSLFSRRAGGSFWIQSNKEASTNVCWAYLWSKEHSSHWSGHMSWAFKIKIGQLYQI